MGRAYDLKRFDPSKMSKTATVCIIGKRRTGKTFALRELLFHMRHIPVGIAMSPTERSNSFFGAFVPDVFIYDDFNTDAINAVLTRQERICEARKMGQVKGLPKDPHVFVVADDCMYDKKNWRSTTVRNCFMNGRHWFLFFVFTMQYCVDIPPDLRSNIDYVIVFRESVMAQKEKLYQYFFGMFPNKQEFIRVFDEVTVDYDYMVLDLTQKSYAVEDCVLWGRASSTPSFRMGDPKFWWFGTEFAKNGASPILQTPAPKPEQIQTATEEDASGDSKKRKRQEIGLGKTDTKRHRAVNKLGDEEEDSAAASTPALVQAAFAPVPATGTAGGSTTIAAGTTTTAVAPKHSHRDRPRSPFRERRR